MAMIIVLTASFIVLVTVSVGAALVIRNIDQVSGGGSVGRAISNVQSAIERVRGMTNVSGSTFAACAQDDCINTEDGTCGVCADALISLGNGNSHKAEITALTNPLATGGGLGFDPVAGSLTILASGYHKNISKEKSSTMCLNYCAIASRNCGDNGCNGSCGECELPQICGGGGASGVCGIVTSCNDIVIECGDECVEGDTCGGGVVINAANNIVDIGGGCQDTDGGKCHEGDDIVTKSWDSAAPSVSGATDIDDGRNNHTVLDPQTNTQYEAVKFCDDMQENGFSNWYLPSQNELNTDLQASKDNAWTTGYSGTCYWSSTEDGETTAYYDDLNTFLDCGGGVAPDKSLPLYVRCIRRY